MPRREGEFLIHSDIEVEHAATGARWSTYRYENPDDACSSLTESPGAAGDGDHPTAAELRPQAVALLRRLAVSANSQGAEQ